MILRFNGQTTLDSQAYYVKVVIYTLTVIVHKIIVCFQRVCDFVCNYIIMNLKIAAFRASDTSFFPPLLR